MLGPTAWLQAETILSTGSPDWSVLHIIDAVDPVLADADFNTTWFNPTTGGYTGGTYDGPAFETGSNAPFHYNEVGGLSGGTTLTTPTSGSRYSSYFYKIINLSSSTLYSNLSISMLADDGAFVYLNGVLIARDNVADPDVFTAFATSNGSESNFDSLPLIGSPVLNSGPNLLAISVHQRSATSSDLGFDLTIEGDPILVSADSGGWAMLSSVDDSVNGYDPAGSDADFNTSWHSQSLVSYPGIAYDGPMFTQGQQAPFAFGGVDGISTPNTTIPAPNSGTRGSAYFIKEIDGGASGYNQVEFTVLADDGAFIYLNGNLVAVVGDLPNDASQDTWGQLTGADGSETTLHTFTVSGLGIVQPDWNLLAVSLHQTSTTSSDLGFSLEMSGKELSAPNILRGPYLQAAGHDRMTVRWRTESIGDSVLRYGDAPGNLTETVTLSELTIDHVVDVTGLDAATRYYYEISSTNPVSTETVGATSTYYFQTHPTPGEQVPARIWVIGDSGTTSTAKDAVYDAYLAQAGAATHTDAWLMLGDNAYNSGTDEEFQAAVFDSYPELLRNTVMWSCIGNHESYTSGGAPYLDIHTFPTAGESGGVGSGTELYYSFDHGNIHFISIDSQTSSNINDVPGGTAGMVDWLELDLQATDKDWIVAFFHHGPYTKGSHDSDTESHHIRVRQYITPLLERYGVDLVLSGHSHAYERSMLLNGHHSDMSIADSKSGSFVEATHAVDAGNGSTLGSVDGTTGAYLLSGETGAYEKPLAEGEKGAVYVICGASGKLSNWDDDTSAIVNPTPHPVFVVNLRVMGSMILEVDGNSLNAQYIDGTGAIRDDFTILKGSTYEIAPVDSTFAEFGPDSTATVRLTRSGALSIAEDVSYQLSGTATSGVDYSPSLNGSVAFLTGESSRDIILTRAADALAEGNEMSQLALSLTSQAAGSGGALRQKYFIGAGSSASVTLQDTPSQSWWFDAFGAAELAEMDWALDTDNDGLDRLFEYAFGGTVGVNDADRLPQLVSNGGFMEMHYWKDHALADLTYTVEAFTDLETLTPTAFTNTLEGTSNPTGAERWKGSVPVDAPMKFMRISIQK